jgi:collagen type III alpha
LATDNRNRSGQGGNQGGSDDTNRQTDQGGQSGRGQSGQGSDDQSSQGQGSDSDINSNDAEVEGWKPGQVGEVQDPQNDGRLKDNRMEGRTLGTTEHAKEAPYAKGDDDDSQSSGSGGSDSQSGQGGSQGGQSGGGGNNR